jgi:LCP family protein required for cell wall assembly
MSANINGNNYDQYAGMSAAFSLEDCRPIPVKPEPVNIKNLSRQKKKWILIVLAVVLIFFTPWRINVLLLGIDPTNNGSAMGRSDTMILTSIPAFLPVMHMLSIPRDLYVDIPGHGQNRINTAHYFAEIDQTGSGPKAAAQTVAQDFKVYTPYTVRIKVDGFKDVVKAMGGVDITLPADMAGLTAGKHHLNAPEALTFVRSRTGSDDIFRQQRQQLFLKSAFVQMLNPLNWWRIPQVTVAIIRSIDTNVPFFYWPRIVFSVFCSSIGGFHMQTFDRNTMITPWVTEGGGQVLLPNWDAITPMIEKYFK